MQLLLIIFPLLTLILLTINLLLFTVREARRVAARRQLSSESTEEREFSSEKSNDGTTGEIEECSRKSDEKAELKNQARRLNSAKKKYH